MLRLVQFAWFGGPTLAMHVQMTLLARATAVGRVEARAVRRELLMIFDRGISLLLIVLDLAWCSSAGPRTRLLHGRGTHGIGAALAVQLHLAFATLLVDDAELANASGCDDLLAGRASCLGRKFGAGPHALAVLPHALSTIARDLHVPEAFLGETLVKELSDLFGAHLARQERPVIVTVVLVRHSLLAIVDTLKGTALHA